MDLPQLCCHTVAETMAAERDKLHLETWNSQVYSAPVWAQRSHPQSLRGDFFFPYKYPGPPPSPSRQCSCLRSCCKITRRVAWGKQSCSQAGSCLLSQGSWVGVGVVSLVKTLTSIRLHLTEEMSPLCIEQLFFFFILVIQFYLSRFFYSNEFIISVVL